MPKATDQLLNDHKMIRKILESFAVDHPRFPEILKTLQRVVLGHAWFEDEVFLPAFAAEPLLQKRFTDEIVQEHKDLAALLRVMRKTPSQRASVMASLVMQTRAVLTAHLAKEEDALFPLAEQILDGEGLNALGAEMERRKTEARFPAGEDA